jgi:hypothetical protein
VGLRCVRSAGAFAASVTMVASLVSPADAHYVYEEEWAYHSDDANCTQVYSEISHGGGGGYVKVVTKSEYKSDNWWGGAYPCAANFTVPAGYIANRPTWWKWNPKANSGRGAWQVCVDNSWWYMPGKGSSFEIHLKPIPDDEPHCGAGYYGDFAGGYVAFNGTWYGGWVWSGYHLLPPA